MQHSLEICNIAKSFDSQNQLNVYKIFLQTIGPSLSNSSISQEICTMIWTDCLVMKEQGMFLDVLVLLLDVIFRNFQQYQTNQLFIQILEKIMTMMQTMEKSGVVDKVYDFII